MTNLTCNFGNNRVLYMAHKIGVHPIFLLSSAGLLTLGKLREKEAALYRHRPGAHDSFLALSFTFVSLFVLLNKEKQWASEQFND